MGIRAPMLRQKYLDELMRGWGRPAPRVIMFARPRWKGLVERLTQRRMYRNAGISATCICARRWSRVIATPTERSSCTAPTIGKRRFGTASMCVQQSTASVIAHYLDAGTLCIVNADRMDVVASDVRSLLASPPKNRL